MPEEARLVGSGTFRVDLRAAFEKLKRYRDPAAGPLMFWTRCAVAAGATRLEESLEGASLRMSFDGAPLPPASLDDPLGALFSDVEPEPAARQFALGVLHAWRPGMDTLTVQSGVGAARRQSTIGPDGTTLVKAAPEPKSVTVITLVLKKRDKTLTSHPRSEEAVSVEPRRLTWTPCRIESRVDGRRVSTEGGEPPGPVQCDSTFGGVRVRLAPSPDPLGPTVIDVYHHGVFVDALSTRGPAPAVLGKVDDPQLTLDLAQSSRLDGERVAVLADLVDRGRPALAGLLARDLAALLPAEAAQLRSAGRWPAMAPYPKAAMRWLRAACLSPMMSAPATASVLLRAPLMLDKDLVPVTLESLAKAGKAAVVQSFDVRGFPDALNVWAESGISEADLAPLLEAAARLFPAPLAPSRRRRRRR